ncbi:DUF4214 domain-containing protein [Pseudomonas guariconensis]|uniref:DUF4214 domain-containing protein n=1 Tax=Pseudomonas guariconensis TaxID=1288410 RepID=UPI0025AA08FD|nr:DUF4214 domain-containing protein [Pseudomonas guariconensis]MDM9596603.1 DUF4214 domain-containing protein [Pseudomonas guariconensis]MDM9609449.1 DUF4214 domain-containing protein [Pseudomonas guariconensis]
MSISTHIGDENVMAITSAQVQQLYVGLLGRAADQAGLNYWLGELNATPAKLTLENLRANIVNEQPEYKAIFGSLSRTDTVTKIYANLFGRAPDPAGLTYWTTGDGASVNIDQLTLAFINGASTADTQALTNKAVVAEVYTSTVGANFNTADAAAIISGVTNVASTVTDGIAKLNDGSLSGIAVPAGVAQLQAKAAATKAQTDFQTAKLTDLTKLSADLTAVGKTIKADNTTVTSQTPATTGTTDAKFTGLVAAIQQEITDARNLIGDGSGGNTVTTTADLQTNADAKAKTLADATTALKAANVAYIDKVTAYQAAYNTSVAAVDADPTAVSVAKGNVANLTFNATVSQKADLIKALNDTGLFATALTATAFDSAADASASVDAIYTAVTDKASTVNAVAAVETALSNYGYSSLKPLAAQHKDYQAKQDALTTAGDALKAAGTSDALETAYIGAVAPAAVAAKAVVDSKAVDALATSLKAAVDANTALGNAVSGINVPSNVVDFAGGATVNADIVGGDSDVFYFNGGITAAKDGEIINAGALGPVKGTTAIYLGSDYVKGTGTANADGTITGGNDSVKEVFFFQKGNDTYVIAETKAYGSSTVTGPGGFTDVTTAANTPDAAVIKLTGVGIEKVAFENGVVSIA